MPTVAELSALYSNFMLGPRRGPDVCDVCFNLTDGYARCYACSHGELHLDAVSPISYSVAGEQLHHALRGYKRFSGPIARRLAIELAAVLWRSLEGHEACLARDAAVGHGFDVVSTVPSAFDVVTTVPSGDPARDEAHPLRWIVGEVVGPTRERYERLLARSSRDVPARSFSTAKFTSVRELAGESVLLVDDTWTTGASAQSAAAALKSTGAGRVAALVIGRHVTREWHENDRRLRALAQPFDWGSCGLCG